MKQLVLMRHAEARASCGEEDYERVLTDYGILGAEKMGQNMAQKGIRPGKILVSSALRTRQTWEILKKSFNYSPEVFFDDLLYLASNWKLYDYIRNTDKAIKTLMIIAHNPGIQMLSNWLSESSNRFLPGGFSVIHFSMESWSEIESSRGTLKDFVTPWDDSEPEPF